VHGPRAQSANRTTQRGVSGRSLARESQTLTLPRCTKTRTCFLSLSDADPKPWNSLYLSDFTSCLSPVLHVVSSVQRQPPIWWCHQLVAHPSEIVRLPWQVHERGTVYRQLSAQPPHLLSTSFTFKKELKSFLFGLSFCL